MRGVGQPPEPAGTVALHADPFFDYQLPRGARRGTVLLFGGFDSLIEEFFVVWRILADAGLDVVAFEGPGQGGARTRHGLCFEHDWERPVRAVLGVRVAVVCSSQEPGHLPGHNAVRGGGWMRVEVGVSTLLRSPETRQYSCPRR